VFQPLISRYDLAMSEERHIAVTRTARYYVIGEESPDVNDVWFVCHGYGQLASDFIREFESIADPRRLIVAPEALSRYYISTAPEFHGPDSKVGATWMTRDDREVDIADYVGYLADLYASIMTSAGNARVTVVGFSQGGATASRWLMRGSPRVDRLILWGSMLPADVELNSAAEFFRSVELTLVYGKRDQYATEEMIVGYQKKLSSHSVPFTAIAFDGGHRMDRETLGRIALTTAIT